MKIVTFLRCYGWLLIVAAMLAVFNSVYVVAGVTPSTFARLITAQTLPICFATWVQADARSRRCTPCCDFGMFVLATWILSVPWYLIWTRGWRGLLVTASFFGLLILPSLTAVFVWILVAIVTA